MSKSKFIFDHVEKTAGVSLHNAFKAIFPDYLWKTGNSNRHLELLQTGAAFLGGHFWFSPSERLSSEYYYCSVLRDPVQRFISQYYFSRQLGMDLMSNGNITDIHLTDPQVVISLKLKIDDFVMLQGPIKNSFSNMQSRHFASRITESPNDLNDDDLADAAIASLEAFDLVGSFDNLQGFVDAIARDFGLSSVMVSRLNVTRQHLDRGKVSRGTIEALSKANSADYKLLAWAKDRFNWESPHGPLLRSSPIERLTENVSNENILTSGFVNKKIRIINTICYGEESGTNILWAGEPIIVDVDIEANVFEPQLTLGIAIYNRDGALMYGVNSNLLGEPLNIDRLGNHRARIRMENPLGTGPYAVTIALHKGPTHNYGCYHWLDNANFFAVAVKNGVTFSGASNCQAEIKLVN